MSFRLIVDAADDGPWNMAVDEALLESCCAQEAQAPTLRLYGWRGPTLSLGRSQPAATAHDARYLRDEAIDLVRRPTGGGAVLHEHERTYAVVARLGRQPFPRGPAEAFRIIASALRAALGGLGLDVEEAPAGRGAVRRSAACFGSAAGHEITWSGLKVVGSAQLRRRGAFLQHGSILLGADPRRLARAVGAAGSVGGFVDLQTALGALPAPAALDGAIVAGFAETLGAVPVVGQLSAEERGRAERLRAEKYAAPAWTWGV